MQLTVAIASTYSGDIDFGLVREMRIFQSSFFNSVPEKSEEPFLLTGVYFLSESTR